MKLTQSLLKEPTISEVSKQLVQGVVAVWDKDSLPMESSLRIAVKIKAILVKFDAARKKGKINLFWKKNNSTNFSIF